MRVRHCQFTIFPAHLSRLPPPSPLKHALVLTRRERCLPPIPPRLLHPLATPRNGNLHSPHTFIPPLLPSTMTDILPPPSKFTRDQLVRNLQVCRSVPLALPPLNISRSSALSRLHSHLSYPSRLPCPVPPPHLPTINGNCPPPLIRKGSRDPVCFHPSHSKPSPQKMASSGRNSPLHRPLNRSNPQWSPLKLPHQQPSRSADLVVAVLMPSGP